MKLIKRRDNFKEFVCEDIRISNDGDNYIYFSKHGIYEGHVANATLRIFPNIKIVKYYDHRTPVIHGNTVHTWK